MKIFSRIYLPLRGYDKHGRFVLLMRNGNSNPKTMQMEEMFKVRTITFKLGGLTVHRECISESGELMTIAL